MDTPHPHTQRAAPFRVAALSFGDVPKTAALHEELLPNGLFPALGRRFLRHWHRTFITSPHGVGLTAYDDDGRCCGFLIGTVDQRRYTEEVLGRHTYRLAAIGLAAMATRPRLAAHFLRTRAARYLSRITRVRGGTGSKTGAQPTSAAAVAVLHAVVTDPASRGRGVGAALLQQFEKELRHRGVPTLRLITLASGGAGPFYSRLGYVEADRRTNRDGEAVIEFERHLRETT